MSTTFELDTSGSVRPYANRIASASELIYWSDLSPFVQGYVEAMFVAFGPYDWRDEHGGAWPSKFSDLAPATLQQIAEDCERLQQLHGEWPSAEHGRGFWVGRQKRNHAPLFPPLTLSLNDTGQVVFAPEQGSNQ